jgi:hypothetical protein
MRIVQFGCWKVLFGHRFAAGLLFCGFWDQFSCYKETQKELTAMSEKRLLVLVFNSVVLASFLATVILVSIASAKMYILNYCVKLRIDNEFGRNPYGVFFVELH